MRSVRTFCAYLLDIDETRRFKQVGKFREVKDRLMEIMLVDVSAHDVQLALQIRSRASHIVDDQLEIRNGNKEPPLILEHAMPLNLRRVRVFVADVFEHVNRANLIDG